MSNELIPGLVAFLLADPMLGPACGHSVSPVILPEGVSRGLTYHCAGGSSVQTFDTRGAQRLRVQFDCHATSYGAANAMRIALRDLLDGFGGQLPDGIFLTGVWFIQPIDFFDNEPGQFRCSAEYYFDFS